MASERLYLDHAATTPVLPEVQAAMAEALQHWANPSSPHADGRAARSALEEARTGIAEALGWRHDVILASGASEAIGTWRRPGSSTRSQWISSETMVMPRVSSASLSSSLRRNTVPNVVP